MKHVRIFAAVLFVLLSLSPLAAQTRAERDRGFMFEIGLGLGKPVYDPATASVFDLLDADPTITHVTVGLDLGLGYAIGPKSYLILRASGVGDRYEDSIDFLQMNLYLYSIEGRFYPFTTGLFLEGGIGASRAVLQDSVYGTSSTDFGTGAGLGLGYEFSSRKTGFTLAVKVRVMTLTIEGDVESAGMALLCLTWK